MHRHIGKAPTFRITRTPACKSPMIIEAHARHFSKTQEALLLQKSANEEHDRTIGRPTHLAPFAHPLVLGCAWVEDLGINAVEDKHWLSPRGHCSEMARACRANENNLRSEAKHRPG